MNTTFKAFAAGLIFTVSGFANSSVINTFGTLTSDSATNFITDTASGLEYLRFGANDLSITETLATADADGFVFDGFRIATADDALTFINAILGVPSSTCDSLVITISCGTLIDFENGDFGNQGPDGTANEVFLFAPNSISIAAAIAADTFALGNLITSDPSLDDGDARVFFNPNLTTSIRAIASTNPSLLLVRVGSDLVNVPAPSTLAIFALGLVGLVSRRFKKQS